MRVCAVGKQPYLFINTSTLDPDFTNTKFYSPTAHDPAPLAQFAISSYPDPDPTHYYIQCRHPRTYLRKQSVFSIRYRTFFHTIAPNLVPLPVYYHVDLHASEF
jgi:hypothetical protein